jgi:hypothetical protein
MKTKQLAHRLRVTAESYQPPILNVGDGIMKGKFKNSPAIIKGFEKDKHKQPVLKTDKGDVQLFKPRIVKLMSSRLEVTAIPDKGKFTCPKCSGGTIKGHDRYTKRYDFGFDDDDYDENKPAKVFKECNNCGTRYEVKLKGKRKNK